MRPDGSFGGIVSFNKALAAALGVTNLQSCTGVALVVKRGDLPRVTATFNLPSAEGLRECVETWHLAPQREPLSSQPAPVADARKLRAFMQAMPMSDRPAFAASVGTTAAHLRNVAFSGKTCSPQLAVAIERESGGAVRRLDMRPDDWHLIWPELLDGAASAARPKGAGHVD